MSYASDEWPRIVLSKLDLDNFINYDLGNINNTKQFWRCGEDCNCLELLSKEGTGNCEDIWKATDLNEEKLWCYVDPHANCPDQQRSEFHPDRAWSYHACKVRQKSRRCCKDIRNIDCLCFSLIKILR